MDGGVSAGNWFSCEVGPNKQFFYRMRREPTVIKNVSNGGLNFLARRCEITATAMFYWARGTRLEPFAAMKYNRFAVAR